MVVNDVPSLPKGTLIGWLKRVCPHCASDDSHPVLVNGSHRQLVCNFCGEHITFVPKKARLIPVGIPSEEGVPLTQREQVALKFAASWLGGFEGEPTDAQINFAFDFADRAAGIFLARRQGA